MSKDQGVASPSAIDCICCALGGAILLWVATIAVGAKQSSGIQSLVLISIEIEYNTMHPASFPGEVWKLDDLQVARFGVSGDVEPLWNGWPELIPGNNGACSFAPIEPRIEVLSFSAMFERRPTEDVASRNVLIQNAANKAKGNISVQWEQKPKAVTIRVVSNGHDTVEKRLATEAFSSNGMQVLVEPGQLFAPEPLP